MVKIGLLLLVCVSCCVLGVCQGGSLSKNFYKKTCPIAEQIVRDMTWVRVASNPTLPAKLIRLHFHDCFVQGCDASILLNSTENNRAEKDALPNLSLGGFGFIDEVKTVLEESCPGVVSCADILALVARDSVSFMLERPTWEVLTGRRDGTVSQIEEAIFNIPKPFDNFTTLKQSFSKNGLTVKDLVVLSGAHTIGIGHCNFFTDRLYNFKGRKGHQDPSLNQTYASFLKTQCPNINSTNAVPMDPTTPTPTFDAGYYTNLLQNKGMFTSDAALLTNSVAAKWVKKLVNGADFFTEFGQSMKRMGDIGVLTGARGEIRKICSAVNS